MARKWLNLFAGAALSFAVAGNALADEGKITVFAAASLTNAMQDIATQYKKEKGVDVVSSFASSSTLQCNAYDPEHRKRHAGGICRVPSCPQGKGQGVRKSWFFPNCVW